MRRAIFLGFIATFALTATVAFAPSASADNDKNGALCTGISAPKTVQAGASFTATVQMQNSGKKNWEQSKGKDTNKKYFLNAQAPRNNTIWGLSHVNLPVKKVKRGETATFTLQAKAPATPGTYPFAWQMLQHNVEWFGQTCQTTITVTAPPSPQADIVVSTSGPQSVLHDGILDYTVQVQNKGPAPATKVVLISSLHASFVTPISVSDARCTIGGPQIVCQLGTLQAGQATTISIKAKLIGTQAPCNFKLAFAAQAYGRETDPNKQNNYQTTNTRVDCPPPPPSADLSITKEGPASLQRSNTIGYNVFVRNAGPAAASNIVVRDPIPEGTVVDNLTDSRCVKEGNELVCRIPTLAANAQVRFTPVFNAAFYETCTPLTVRNTASVTSTTADPIMSNNVSQTVVTSLECPPPPAGSAKLTIAQKQLATTNTVVKNQKNVNLLRFEGRASETDVLLTQSAFVAAQGSVHNAQNYMLWVDTDGNAVVDTIVQKGVPAQNGKVTFNQIIGGGYVVPNETTVVFEVHADIAQSLASPTLQLAFATTDTQYVLAETLNEGQQLTGISTDGTCNNGTTCDITVTTNTSTLYTIVSQGSLFVTQDHTPLRNRQLLGGESGEAILRLNFRAEAEDIDVTDLQFTSVGGFARSVDRLELYTEGATTPFATATVSGCGSDSVPTTYQGMSVQTFCANTESRQLVIPRGTDVKVLVKPRMKTDVDGAISGEPIQFVVISTPVSNNASGEGAVRARGDVSSNNLSANDGDAVVEGEVFIGTNSPAANSDILGKKHVSVLSKITAITNANPDANGTNVPTGVSDVGQFKFTAAPNANFKNGSNRVTFTDIIFTVTAPNVGFDSNGFKVYNKANSTVKSPCIVLDSVASPYTIACWDIRNAGVDTSVFQGWHMTLVLEANITNNQADFSSPSSLQVSLENFSDASQTGMAQNLSHISWVDEDAGSNPTRFWWIEYPETVVKSTAYQD